MNSIEARKLADKTNEERKANAAKNIDKILKHVETAAKDGKYDVELKCLNEYDAQVLREEPYCFEVLKFDTMMFSTSYSIKWNTNPKDMFSDL